MAPILAPQFSRHCSLSLPFLLHDPFPFLRRPAGTRVPAGALQCCARTGPQCNPTWTHKDHIPGTVPRSSLSVCLNELHSFVLCTEGFPSPTPCHRKRGNICDLPDFNVGPAGEHGQCPDESRYPRQHSIGDGRHVSATSTHCPSALKSPFNNHGQVTL